MSETAPQLPQETTPLPEPAPAPTGRGAALRALWGRLSLSNLQIIVVLLIVIGGQLAIDFGRRIFEGQQKVAEQDTLEAQIQTLQSEQQQLEEDKSYYNSPAYIEEWAHSSGKMVLPGEKIVVPLYKGQPQPKPTQTNAPQPQQVARWVTWWYLFFDSPPPIAPPGQ